MSDELIKAAAQRLCDKNEISQEECDSITKMAGPWAWFKNLASKGGTKAMSVGKKVVGQGVAKRTQGQLLTLAAAGGTAMIGKELVVDPIVESNKIKKSFAAMQKKVPQLAEKDQEQLKDYFDVVKTFSPKSAANPLVAGHLVNKMIEFGGVDHKLVQDISAIQAGMVAPKLTQTALEAGARAVAGVPPKPEA